MKITRKQAKKKAQSRDCSCVNGKDRDSNFNEVIDEVFDYIKELETTIRTLQKLNSK
jgi:hypothetical protein